MNFDYNTLIETAGEVGPLPVLNGSTFNVFCAEYGIEPVGGDYQCDIWSAVNFFCLGAAAAMMGLAHRTDEDGKPIE